MCKYASVKSMEARKSMADCAQIFCKALSLLRASLSDALDLPLSVWLVDLAVLCLEALG